MPGIYSVHDAIIGVQSALGGGAAVCAICCVTSSRPTARRCGGRTLAEPGPGRDTAVGSSSIISGEADFKAFPHQQTMVY